MALVNILILFSIFLGKGSFAGSNPPMLHHLDEGVPGCWDQFHGSVLTSSQIAALSSFCKNLRRDYLEALEIARTDARSLEKKMIQSLTKAKSGKSPYEAIFFATLIHTEKLKAALLKRAEVERKLQVPFPFALAASARLGGQECGADSRFLNKAYEEICLATDSILPTYFVQTPKARGEKRNPL